MPIGLVRRLATVAVVGAASIAGAAGPAGAETTGDAEAAFLARVTAARKAQGLAPLPLEADLVSVARAHSGDMAAASRLFHNDALAQQVQNWISVGENVGAGTSVDQVHQTFMSSTVHRGDILSTRYTGIGIGAVFVNGTLWVTEVFRQRAGAVAAAEPPPPEPVSPPVTEPPPPPLALQPVIVPDPAPVIAPPVTAAPARPRAVAARSLPAPASITAPPTSSAKAAPPTTEPPVPELTPAEAGALAGPAAEVDLGSAATAAAEPVAPRLELVASSLVAVALLGLVAARMGGAALARRRPAYLHRVQQP